MADELMDVYIDGAIFTTGDDWFYDRAIFDSLSSEVKTITIPITVHSDIERQDDKSSNDTQTSTIVYGKEDSGVQE